MQHTSHYASSFLFSSSVSDRQWACARYRWCVMGIEWKVRLLEGWEAVSKGVNGRFESLVKGQLIPVDNGTWEEGIFVGIGTRREVYVCCFI